MEKKVSVEISARHVHLSEEVYKKLFGEDAEMTSVKDLTGGEEPDEDTKDLFIDLAGD